MTSRRVVVIGPGKLGSGFLAPLFIDAGWDVTFAARTLERNARIDGAPFAVRTAPDAPVIYRVPSVLFGSEAFDEAVADADLVVTTVGVEAVAGLGGSLAKALATRPAGAGPLDVWVVENADVAPALEQAVNAAGNALPPVGFAGAIAYPIVARGSWDSADTPEFVRDTGIGLRVDVTRLLSPIPRLPGVEPTVRYEAHLAEKRFVFGAGHALSAYVGALLGYERVDEAAKDPFIRSIVESCLREARAALERGNPGLGGDAEATVADAMARYENEALEDPISRVARSPIRKLGATGAVLGAAKLVVDTFGAVPSAFAVGIAAALIYDDPSDAQALELSAAIRDEGVGAAFGRIAGIKTSHPLHRAVVTAFEALRGLAPGGAAAA